MALLVGAASPSEISAAAPGLNPKNLAHMDYFLARKAIVKDGWRPVSGPCEQVSEDECTQFPEIEACSGVGPGYCALAFVKGDRCLYVTTTGGRPKGRKGTDVHVEEAEGRPGPCVKN
jgi:hypothetical protein